MPMHGMFIYIYAKNMKSKKIKMLLKMIVSVFLGDVGVI